MANTVKVSREVKQHEGKKFMTAKGIAEMSGIAHGALTNRLILFLLADTTKRIHMGSLFFKIWHIVYEKTTKKRGEKK